VLRSAVSNAEVISMIFSCGFAMMLSYVGVQPPLGGGARFQVTLKRSMMRTLPCSVTRRLRGAPSMMRLVLLPPRWTLQSAKGG